jgi:hypothetical protein
MVQALHMPLDYVSSSARSRNCRNTWNCCNGVDGEKYLLQVRHSFTSNKGEPLLLIMGKA